MNTRHKVWMAAVLAGLIAYVVAALVLPNSFRLTALSDVTEALLLLSGAVSFVPLALRSTGKLRLFWSLIIFGILLWFSYQLLWTYYEVLLRRDVPDLFAGDVILFLHIVPMMAALALRPHMRRDEYAARVGRLDFALLMVWWFYLYVLTVIPWQYVVADIAAYNRNLNAVYLAEKLALLLVLGACWAGSEGQWRKLYISLFGMSLSYSASSALANWAIARNVFYSGSIYDVPLAFATAWLTWIGLRTRTDGLGTEIRQGATAYGVWVARCGMIAVFSLPLFAAWAITDATEPSRIRVFRLVATLCAAFVMGMMVFVRQHLLDRELFQLLGASRESFANLQRLQAQILHSEKLASIGQLVGGAAHELNNPITAMLGYSDLLLSTALTPRQQPLADKIGQDVRRTRSLVASLISFARQSRPTRTPLDLNTLARTAVKLTQSQWESLKITVQTEFDPQLPRVLGDSNQLLQVCLQLLGHCFDATDVTRSILTVRTEHKAGKSELLVATGLAEAAAGDSPSIAENSLGLSACQGIVQEHGGKISAERTPSGAVLLRVELPGLEPAPLRAKESTVPVRWPSRPFV